MAGAVIAGLAGDVLSNGLGSLINAGANAINQRAEFDFNRQLQQNSFNHDKEMLNAQIQATKQLQADMIAIKQGVLAAGGFSPTDAARGAVNAPMTQALDWSGTRYWAPGSMKTTSYSGKFVSMNPVRQVEFPQPKKSAAIPSSASSVSSGRTNFTNSTQSTVVSTSSVSPSRGSSAPSTLSRATTRTSNWVEEQNRNLEPYMRGALQTTFVTPPSSRASSNGTVSTVPKGVLDSWTPAFNTRRQPLFAYLRKKGESQV
uniref:Minor structural protein n=2 Tax=Norovirus GII TaxID=122929 RepID=A0A0H3VBV0_NORV|nr:minor structural protein [Norovirus Hu/GII.P22/GII.5/Kaohsiung/12-AV-1/2012/TW]